MYLFSKTIETRYPNYFAKFQKKNLEFNLILIQKDTQQIILLRNFCLIIMSKGLPNPNL